MTKLNHERWFLKNLDNFEKAKRTENKRSRSGSGEDFFSLADQGTCPLCEVTVRALETMRHAFFVHGIPSREKFEREIEIKNEQKRLYSELHIRVEKESKLREILDKLHSASLALQWSEEEHRHFQALAEAVKMRLDNLHPKDDLRREINKLKAESVDKWPHQGKVWSKKKNSKKKKKGRRRR